MLTLYTARKPHRGERGYTAPDAFDVTRGAAEEARAGGEALLWEPFAPSRELLAWGIARCREGRREECWPAYVERYRAEMRESFTRHRAAWAALLARRGEATLVCYCREARLCHRTVLAQFLAAAARKEGIPVELGGERSIGVRALTVHQPWASFLASGVKTIETRSWGTSYRGPVAIHAGREGSQVGITHTAGFLADRAGMDSSCILEPGAWPLGAVVAVAELTDVIQVARVESRADSSVGIVGNGVARTVPRADLELGDLSIGRFGWVFERVRPLREPVPAKGRQGLWTLDEEAERAVRAQLEEAAHV